MKFRYSDLLKFHEYLQNQMKLKLNDNSLFNFSFVCNNVQEIILPKFPEKKFFSIQNEEFLENRMKELGDYFEELIFNANTKTNIFQSSIQEFFTNSINEEIHKSHLSEFKNKFNEENLEKDAQGYCKLIEAQINYLDNIIDDIIENIKLFQFNDIIFVMQIEEKYRKNFFNEKM